MSLSSDPRWSEALGHLPDYLGNHVRVSVTALALGLLVSLPLAIAARNAPVLRGALLGLASIVQTVPGLALLALFYPLLLALAALSLSWFGVGFSAFGFLPAVLALALYSMLPVLRNTITGLRGVDALEAGDGVAQHRQHRIERERQPRGQESERRETETEPRQRQGRQRQQQRIEQRQQRQARHRLHDAGEPEQHAARYATITYRNRHRQADRETQRQRRDADPHMIAEIIRQMRQRLAPAWIGE